MATTRKSAKRQTPRRTYAIPLTGELEGFNVTMASMSGRDIIRIRGGKLSESEGLELIASHCLAHDFDVEDIRDLDYWILIDILRQWSTALREAALPQPTGDS